MAQVKLSQLRTRTRQRADMVRSQFVSDSELNSYINASAQELYDLLVEANLDYFTTSIEFTVSGGRGYYQPAESMVYKLRGLDFDIGGSWTPVWPYEYLERGRLQDGPVSRLTTTVKYRLIGTRIEFLPADQASGTYRMRYVPFMQVMVHDTDTFDGYNGFEEYIVVDAAMKCKDKEESSVQVLKDQKKALLMRVQAMANTRDYSAPDRIQDVRGSQNSSIVDSL